MNASTRIIVNTGAQYGRAIICALLSLYSTRIILQVLGMSDYGLYTLIAGVVALLGFITNALVITTQRYLSYHWGKGNFEYVKQIFANSLTLHIVFAIGIGIVLITLMSWIFGNILNIEADRVDVAKTLYLLAILMLQVSILTAPFKAAYVAHENIVYISIVEVVDAILRVGIAIVLPYITMDKLQFYGLTMTAISILNLAAFIMYALIKYQEVHIGGIFRETNRNIIRDLTGFVGWTAYGMGSIVGRNQGIAIIINNFWGTTINASYGIGCQIYGILSIVSSSIINAFNPQMMKAEGAGNREYMFQLAEKESKYSSMLLQLIIVPILFEMPAILRLWLGIDSENTTNFCRMMLVALMCDQLTYGLNSANQAIGNIRSYCLIMYTPKLLLVFATWLILQYGGGISEIIWAYIGVELTVAIVRLPYMKITAGLHIRQFVKSAICPLIPLLIVQTLVSEAMVLFVDIPFRFLLTTTISVLIGLPIIFFRVLDSKERRFICEKIRKENND